VNTVIWFTGQSVAVLVHSKQCHHNSMGELNHSSEAASRSAAQELSSILCNPECIDVFTTLVTIVNQTSTVLISPILYVEEPL
jgi:hypothetical protein